MRRGNENDRELVVKILSVTFESNPAVRWMLRKGKYYNASLQRMANFVFSKSLRNDGVLISANEKGVALYYKANAGVRLIPDFFEELLFIIRSVPILKIPVLIQRELHRKSIRPASKPYLYFWFLGVLPEDAGAGFELKNALFAEARKQQLPIYLETSIKRNMHVYERIGFQTYHQWIDEAKKITFWFMKWQPGTNDL
ncbi:MAG: hypothetical protein HEQ40_08090 [Lacibacter sp.]|jgi:GNAT superfamily N-acetyltransferase